MSARALARQPVSRTAPPGTIQRRCAYGEAAPAGRHCPASGTQQVAPRARDRHSTGSLPSVVHDVLDSAGAPLDGAVRSFMEGRFGQDFSRVRVHTDMRAQASAGAVGALAYASGSQIVFGHGQYRPGTTAHARLLAHELTHVVQQRGSGEAVPRGIVDSSAHEDEADRIAEAAVTGQITHPVAGAPVRTAIQRRTGPAASDVEPDEEGTEQAFPGVEQIEGRDPQSLLRLDTVTVVELGANDWCKPCVSMRQDLSDLAQEFSAKPERVRFRAFSLNREKAKNKAIADKMEQASGETSTPQTFVYVERTLVDPPVTFRGYVYGDDYIQKIRDIVQSASADAGGRGAKIGAITGGVAGLVGGAIAGGLIAAGRGGDPMAGGALGALIGGIGAGLVGGSLGWIAGKLFGKDIGRGKLSDDEIAQVKKFLAGGVAVEELDHGLAVNVVDSWLESGGKPADLPIFHRRALVRALMEGFTGDAEERAILKIIENSTDAELLQIFGLGDEDAPRLRDLEAEFDGSEKTYLRELLARLRARFPVDAPQQATEGLLIDRPEVRAALADAFRQTHAQTPGQAPVVRECGGVFVEPKAGGSIEVAMECAVGTSAEVGRIARRAVKGRETTHRVVGSFHTHPRTRPPTGSAMPAGTYPVPAREAPSGADFASFAPDPARGREHYVVGPYVTYLIARGGRFQLLGNTADLLGVERFPPEPGQISTLELG